MSGQALHLKIIGETKEETTSINALHYKTFFNDYKTLENEIKTVKRKLTRLGYIDAVIKEMTKKNDTFFKAELSLGKKINTIRVYYISDFNVELLNFITHKSGDAFFELDIAQLETSLNTLNSKIAEQGDPFSTLQLINITKQNSDLISAELHLTSHKKRRIDKVILKGYDKFPKSYIKHLLKLRTGKSFNINTIQKKIELLEDLQFANKIKDPEVLFTNDSTTLYLYIEKTKTNNFDGYLGFSTNEATSKIELNGYLDLKLNNNLNFGETLNLFYKSDETDQQTIKIDADLPYIFSSPMGVDIGLNLFRKDSTFLNARQYAKLNYRINANHKIAIGLSTVKSTNLLDASTAQLNDYNSNYYTIDYRFVKPQYNDPLFPINFWFQMSSGFGTRTNNTSKQNQNLFSLETYKIFNLNTTNSIYTKLNGALLTSNNYLTNELFRFGGINSIRGFEENSLEANLFTVLNTEYRYRLSNTLYIHSIIDAAYFENNLTHNKQKRFGFGFGLGLLTNAGLFRLNYSGGKTENIPFKFSNSKIHVSLTSRF